ncbi:hypothetical protein MKX01_001210 [Papaver californicum]|nr:hypothetical protein MKX01_001210 [Papaver californicum]
MSSRRRVRTAKNTRGRGNGEVSDVVEMMRLMTEVMTNQTATIMALIQNHNGNNNVPPPGGNANGPDLQGTGDQTTWLKLLEKFVRLKPPQFEGSTDPLVVDKWKKDIDKILRQLVVFQLLGEARKWWKNAAIGPMLVDDYLDRYISLHHFWYFMTHDEDKSARKIENGLGGLF